MTIRRIRVVALALLVVGGAQDAGACSCGSGGAPPCEAAGTADAVFAGTVRSIDQVDHLDGSSWRSNLVTIEIERGFINASPGLIQVTSGMGGGFQLRHVARASGFVVDATGRPLPGVSVDAVAAELAGHQPPPYQGPVRTDEHGRFEFDDLPPGLYVFA